MSEFPSKQFAVLERKSGHTARCATNAGTGIHFHRPLLRLLRPCRPRPEGLALTHVSSPGWSLRRAFRPAHAFLFGLRHLGLAGQGIDHDSVRGPFVRKTLRNGHAIRTGSASRNRSEVLSKRRPCTPVRCRWRTSNQLRDRCQTVSSHALWWIVATARKVLFKSHRLGHANPARTVRISPTRFRSQGSPAAYGL